MKNITIILIISLLSYIFLLSGCGQEFDVTVYNATGISEASGWVDISVNTDNINNLVSPTTFAATDADCNSSNSYTFKAKENQVLYISGNGATYSTDTDGTITENSFSIPSASKTLYGDLLSTPHWYAAVNTASVVFYSK